MAFSKARVAVFAAIACLIGTAGCAAGTEAGDAPTGRSVQALDGEENPHEPGSADWCWWEWRFGGRYLTNEEKNRVRAVLNAGGVCDEAKNGLSAMIDELVVVSDECVTPQMAANYRPQTGRIRLSERYLDNKNTLTHEYGHKLWAASASWTEILFYKESYNPGEPGSEATVYQRGCTTSRNWTYAGQRSVGGVEEYDDYSTETQDEEPQYEDDGSGRVVTICTQTWRRWTTTSCSSDGCSTSVRYELLGEHCQTYSLD